jgi:hypothetical protein
MAEPTITVTSTSADANAKRTVNTIVIPYTASAGQLADVLAGIPADAQFIKFGQPADSDNVLLLVFQNDIRAT